MSENPQNAPDDPASEANAELSDLPPAQAPNEGDSIKGGGSAYIAEAEKNLDMVLEKAKRTDASLLFGESDSLFKR